MAIVEQEFMDMTRALDIFFHWNNRRRSQPLKMEEEPRYTVTSAQ